MNRCIRSSILLLLCISLSVLLLACAGPEDRISGTLSRLGVTDAAPAATHPKLSGEGSVLYTSDSTQMGYYFDPDTGELEDIFDYSMLGRSYREKASASPALAPMQVSMSSKEEELIAYAKACIGDDLIGTLQFRIDQDQGLMHQYTVVAYYDGFKTGTTVIFTTNAAGRIEMCNVAIGSIFERAKDGTYVIAAGDDLIGEEAAIAVARAGLDALDMAATVSSEASCELTAAEDRLIYVVRIPFTDGKDWQRQYLAYVNAHTGELWQEGISR